jgi:hypothetical protein
MGSASIARRYSPACARTDVAVCPSPRRVCEVNVCSLLTSTCAIAGRSNATSTTSRFTSHRHRHLGVQTQLHDKHKRKPIIIQSTKKRQKVVHPVGRPCRERQPRRSCSVQRRSGQSGNASPRVTCRFWCLRRCQKGCRRVGVRIGRTTTCGVVRRIDDRRRSRRKLWEQDPMFRRAFCNATHEIVVWD